MQILDETEPWGRTNLEQKSSADEREAYKGTLSEETRIKIKNFNKNEENRRFSTLVFLNSHKETTETLF